jgi:uncharacterized LabA/DUF88 family protein
MVNRQFIAIYIDLENVAGSLDLQTLMQDLILEENKEDPEEYIFAVKFACGNSSSITKLRSQLTNYNFDIREAPRVTGKKNRADLIISLDAFEKLYLEKPSIDRFVFVTSDSDFSIIMDMLRKYGKEVWLVTKDEDAQRSIFTNCTDNILTLPKKEKGKKSGKEKTEAKQTSAANTKNAKATYARELFQKVLRNLDQNEEYLVNSVGNKMRQLDKSFKITKTSYKRFANLVKEFEQKGLIKTRKSQRGHQVISEINIPEN